MVVLHQNGQDTEQNYNMIDGQINNTPTAAELEEKAKAGEQISLRLVGKQSVGNIPAEEPQ